MTAFITAFILRWWRPVVVLGWACAVAFLTLRGGAASIPSLSGPTERVCFICGGRGTADALLNVVLFVPLGFVLGGGRYALPMAAAAGLAVSLGIELAQMGIVGRDASAADLLWNTMGAVAGVAVHRVVMSSVRRRLRGGGLLWGLAVAVGFVLAGGLLTPAPTDDDYWGQWTPDLGSMPQYDGEVLEATLDGEPMPMGRLHRPRPHVETLSDGWSLAGRVVVGSGPAGVSPILSIYDGHQREILLLGAHHQDLVFRQRTRAQKLRFDTPDHRIVDAFSGLSVGDTVSLEASGGDEGVCMAVAGRRRCGVGVPPGRTWGLLLYVEGPPEWFRVLVDFGWLAALFAPVGLLAADRREGMTGAALGLGGAVAAVALTPMIAGPVWQILACVVGLTVGHAVRLRACGGSAA